MAEQDRTHSAAERGKIDVHAHYLPPVYYEALHDAGLSTIDGGIAVPAWSAEAALAMMDRFGIATEILSVSSPSVHFVAGARAGRLARAVNEAGADYVRAHRGRFGLFATLPLADVAGSLAEIAYAFDRLGADGVVMETNTHGSYLGDPRLDPVFDELNRRRAVIFLHPTSPACFEMLTSGRPSPLIEFPFDTTRAAVNLVLSGTTRRCPALRFILPHAGGTVPYLVQRIAGGSRYVAGGWTADDVVAELRRFYVDTAGAANAHAIPSLRQLIPVSCILFGSDYPFTPEPMVASYVEFLKSTALFTDEERAAIGSGNALKLFPRLADAA